jgi:hypothetical protein
MIDDITIINELGIPVMLTPTISYINTGDPRVAYTLTLLDDDGKPDNNNNINDINNDIHLRIRGDQVRVQTVIKSTIGNAIGVVDVFKPVFGKKYQTEFTVNHYKNPARMAED